jgi:hypothetical protein
MPDTSVCVQARSVSSSVWAQIAELPVPGRVHSLFRRACYLQLGRGNIVALVAPELRNGPVNVVLGREPAEWLGLQPGMLVRVEDHQLRIGSLAVCLDGAATWEPCPDWKRLRTNVGTLLRRLQSLAAWSKEAAPGDSMLALIHGPAPADGSTASAMHVRARGAADAMWAGWQGDEAELCAGAAQLAGLGGGLTPAGDDFVLGCMLCAWLAHPYPGVYCRMALEVSASRTTMLSAAFLRSAARGECGEAWHRLLEALEWGTNEQVLAAASAVLSHGHTSGADALAGFLWTGLHILGC